MEAKRLNEGLDPTQFQPVIGGVVREVQDFDADGLLRSYIEGENSLAAERAREQS